MWRIISLLIIVILFSSLHAQERILLRTNGEQIKLNNKKDLREAISETILTNLKGETSQSIFPPLQNNLEDIDTVSYRQKGGSFNTNFGFAGQDVMMMWFETEADMNIKAIGFTCSDDEGSSNATVQLWLIRLNWTKEQLNNFEQDTYMGYYPSTGDGFNESDYFGYEATGNWISKDSNNPLPPWTDNADPSANTFDNYLWEQWGFTWPTTAVASSSNDPIYNWLELGSFGSDSVTVKRGEMFAIIVTHDGTTLDGDRIGFWSDNTIGYPGWKYYENGRFASDEPGWWVRMYTWDFAVVADITSCMPPEIRIVHPLSTTLSTEPRPVCAEIEMDIDCLGGTDSVRVELVYVLDDKDTNIVQMSTSDNYNYCAEIPGQTPTTSIRYWVQVIDKIGYYYLSEEVDYFIFQPTTRGLLVFNGYTEPTGYPQSYYFGVGDFATYSVLDWNHDTWAYGALTEELVNNYDNIVEITTNGPTEINNRVIRTWLAGSEWRDYFLAGDEWLGAMSTWSNRYEAGTFHNDILGISFVYNDINYANPGDQELPSMVNAVEGSLLGGELFDLHKQVSTDSGWTASIAYDPTYEIGVDNWLDGVDFVDDVEIDMTGIGIDGNTYSIGGHRTLPEGNKIAFFAYDPLSLNSNPDGEYWWYGFTEEAPQVLTLQWFWIRPSVNDDINKMKFSLSQNYPNPFNPSTVIKYSIPVVETRHALFLQLKIYDILGREVATLVNEEQKPGNYEVKFDARNLTSGIYFYKLSAGDFVESRKMLLVK